MVKKSINRFWIWLSADPLGEEGGLNLYGYVGGNPLNFTDPDGRKPGDPFPTADDAAIDALNFIKPFGTNKGRMEHGGLVYRGKNRCFFATPPVEGDSSSPAGKATVDPFKARKYLSDDDQIYGAYNNHPQGASGYFSPDDREWAYSNQKYLWLTGTAPFDEGHKRYKPNKKLPEGVSVSPIHRLDIPDYKDKNVTNLSNETSGKKCE